MATTSLPECLRRRAEAHGDRIALTFLTDESFAGEQAPVRLTYAELYDRSLAVAAQLKHLELIEADSNLDRQANDGTFNFAAQPRVALLYPPGVESLIALIGTQMAGAIPVPASFPRPHREIPRLNASAQDCHPAALLTDRATLETLAQDKLSESLQNIPIVVTDSGKVTEGGQPIDWETVVDANATNPDAGALLQYTSGSTTAARGVVLRHRNLMSNLESIRQAFELDFMPDERVSDLELPDEAVDVGVFWLPFYHDMGLIGGILAPLYIGGHTVLMSPRAFLTRPIRWLQTISTYHASISGAPNFAYQLCVDRIPGKQTADLELSQLRLAFCGAEPVQAKTLEEFAQRFASNGFQPSAFYPCYGLAEATLLVAGGRVAEPPSVLTLRRDDFQKNVVSPVDPNGKTKLSRRELVQLVGCGREVWQTDIKIVDPTNGEGLPDGSIGEIWVRGGGVSDGYWSELTGETAPETFDSDDVADKRSEQRFNVALASGETGFCRSGDLGFVYQNQLYVTGRLKEMIILRGRNLYPQDIEATVRQTVESCVVDAPELVGSDLALCRSAAFAVSGNRGEALAIIAEVPRTLDDERLLGEIVRQIRHAVIDVHDVDPQHIWLTRPATIAVTTSGKTRRVDCRESFLAGDLKARYQYNRSAFSEQSPLQFPDLPKRPMPGDQPKLQQEIEDWMAQWLISRAGINPEEFYRDRPLSEFGLDSLSAVELSGETEDWTGVMLTPEVATDNPSVESLSRFIAQRYVDTRAI
ncbi:AMP-binding protein [Rhodopirellula sp. MGV]|uniref:AMP-binding protein n=1 Tax=Rhodopirellula sp. MGV TaxID=2023130 RepID=UPI00117A348C|nr:AMP-binding protein [Rhodopirellula sp. MGV]